MFIICSLLFAFYRCVSFYFTFLSHSYPFLYNYTAQRYNFMR